MSMQLLTKKDKNMGGGDIMLSLSEPTKSWNYEKAGELELPDSYLNFNGSPAELKKRIEMDLQNVEHQRDVYKTALKKVDAVEQKRNPKPL